MDSKTSELLGSIEGPQQIDRCCQAFENAWKNGDSPRMEEFVARVDPSSRAELIRELLLLELNYRRNGQGAPLSESQIRALHPELMSEIAGQLTHMRQRRTKNLGDGAVTQQMAPKAKEVEQTIDHSSPTSGSRGLHIRCPHCSNPVELLADTPFESITCRTCGSDFSLVDNSDQTREAPTLKKIGRFELVARLGMGGFGTVWKARDTELDRTVAVKIPRKGQLAREEVEQFFREARSAAQLRHPNIVPVHEVGREGETIFIVSDLIRGVSMADWLTGATPNSRETAQLMATVADALYHAHQKGVIHRDLKPSNILLDDAGQPYIMDFGLAKREVGEITMTVEGHILGTPAYMSPEQAAGEGHWTDRRTDIYSMGVILFRMLTGELPFRGNAQMQIHQRLTEDPPDPRKLNRNLPRDMCTICLKCMERNPNRRYDNSKELGEELGRYLRGEPIRSRPISRVERTLRWGKRNPALASAIVLTVFLAIAGPIAAVAFHRQQTRLAARVVENNGLINRYQRDIQRTTGQVTDLRSQLDVWEGRANPWTFWPPKRDESPRRQMIADVLDHSSTTLVKPLQDGKYNAEETARGYVGLAVLAEADGKDAEARDYFQRARKELAVLRRQKPEEPKIARALAECDLALARLDHATDPDMSAKDLQNARAVYKQLATEHHRDPIYQLDWLEAELKSSIGASADLRAEHMSRVEDVYQALKGNWPKGPDAIYRLACYLTEKEPVLSPPTAAALPATKRPDKDATAD